MGMSMLIKNKFIISLLSLSLFSAGAFSAGFSESGSITFTGEIVDNTCVLSEESRDLTVELPVVTSSEFSGVGDYAGEKSFDILLNKCPKSVNTAKVSFDGERDDTSDELFKVHGEGSGVGFAVFDNPDGRISATPLKLGSQSRAYLLKPGASQLNFLVRYRATVPSSDINPGYVKAGGKFIITYN